MAKQTGNIIIVGTIDDITFYEMEGKGYARSKSCLKGERVKRDPRFRRTMQSAHRLGKGSQLASKVYRSLPREAQVYGLFKELKRLAVLTLKEGKGEEAVLALLQERVGKKQEAQKTGAATTPPKRDAVPSRPPCVKKLFGARGGKRHKRIGSGRKPQALVQRE